ncbi:LytTR family DNA-binding domain-containing protein [Ekhidna sp. MALMAid0563]|uniref:LytR/AlgR family response regulator transcription factor n=1 Tax=Ekhidna sp. MALMAid0563 TaxID=3143937 RepID=UPI0032DFB43C
MNYLFGSRILTHILFWIGYFLLFGFIWEKGDGYASSYFLEFVLMPIRIGVSYVAMYWLLPQVLLKKQFVKFLVLFLVLLFVGAILQRFFIHFFYEQRIDFDWTLILDVSDVLRAMILINSTALFLLALKILKLYFEERAINQPIHDSAIEVKADKRFYRLAPSDIMYLEGLGNYVTYYLKDGRKIIGYTSLKKANDELPDHFIRIHKSFIVNAQAVISYDKTSVEVEKDKFLPIGNSYEFEV